MVLLIDAQCHSSPGPNLLESNDGRQCAWEGSDAWELQVTSVLRFESHEYVFRLSFVDAHEYVCLLSVLDHMNM